MDKYIYISDKRITKGNRVVNEDNLAQLGESFLKKAIDKKIIKKQKPKKDHGSKEQDVSEGQSE